MPNILVFRLRPSTPVAGGTFLNYLSGLRISIHDLASHAIVGTDISIVQHDDNAIATAVVELTEASLITMAGVSVRVKFEKGPVNNPILYADYAAYNMQVQNVDALPTVDTYPALTASTHAVLTNTDIDSSNLAALPPNGLAANFAELKTAAISASSLDFLTDAAFSTGDAANIAADILLPWQNHPITEPANMVDPATLEELYTDPDNSFDAQRAAYEAAVVDFNNITYQLNLNTMAGYVYALATALQCEAMLLGKEEAVLEIPTRLTAEPNPAPQPSMRIKLKNTADEVPLDPNLPVPATYIYVHTTNQQGDFSIEERCEILLSEDYDLLLSTISAAQAAGVIAELPDNVNKHQAARRIKALKSTTQDLPVCRFDNTPEYTGIHNLISDWRDDTSAEIADFWAGLSTDEEKAAHRDLIVCGLIYGFESVANTDELPPFDAENTEDFVDKFENDWKGLLLESADESTKVQFVNKVQLYFPVQDSIAELPPVYTPSQMEQVIEAYNGIVEEQGGEPDDFFSYDNYDSSILDQTLEQLYPGNSTLQQWVIDQINITSEGPQDPIAQFINCYIGAAEDRTEDTFFDTPLDPAHLAETFICLSRFNLDTCGQDWLLQKINTLIELKALVSVCDEDLQFSTMEALFSRGFTSRAEILNCSMAEFQNALAGTVAFDCAPLIFLHELAMTCLVADPSKLDQILQILESNGLTSPASLQDFSLNDFQALLNGIIPLQEIKCIYQNASGASDPTTHDFLPVNVKDQLRNCLSPKQRSPFSKIAYLYDLLQASFDANCKEPFPETSPLFADLLKERRGKLAALEVTHTNLCTPIPLIDQVNESLQHMVAKNLDYGTILNNTIEELGGHELLVNGASEQSNEGTFQHDPATLFAALPEHSSAAVPGAYPLAYQILAVDFSAPGLPYSRSLDVLQSYLCAIGTDRFSVMRKFRKEIHTFMLDPALDYFDTDPVTDPPPFRTHLWRFPLNSELAQAYLGFTQVEYDFLFANSTLSDSRANVLYGFPDGSFSDNADTAVQFVEFLQRTGLSFCELRQLQEAVHDWTYVNFTVQEDEQDIALPECLDCEDAQWTVNFNLIPANGLKRIILVIRLYQKLKEYYSFYELRDICEELNLLQTGSDNIDPDIIDKLAAFTLLHKEFGLPLNNGTIAANLSGVYRTQSLALFKDQDWIDASAENRSLWEWAIEAFLDGLQAHAAKHYPSTVRPPDFIELLKENLDPLSVLVGFELPPAADSWNAGPLHAVRFADFLSKFLGSEFNIGEIMWLFSNEHIGGDDPFPLQSHSEAVCYPFNTPDNEFEYSLEELQKKLCAVEVSEEEIAAWTWNRIIATFENEFSVNASDSPLHAMAEKFFPEVLQQSGYAVEPGNRQFKVEVETNAHLWNTTNPGSPFQYTNGHLWYELPLNYELLYGKLSRLRQLDDEERKAVQELLYQPYALLAPIAYLFTDPSEMRQQLVENPNEAARFAFLQKEFALFYQRCKCITAFLADHTDSITCMEKEDGKEVAWALLKQLYADGNLSLDGASWEDPDGPAPEVTWSPNPNGGAFAALLGLTGTGLWCEYYTLDGELAWRDIAYRTEMFGTLENQWNVAVPGILPNPAYNIQFPYAAVRNGFAISGADASALGGAQGFRVKCTGIFRIATGGKYTFMAGAPTAEGEAPEFADKMQQQWSVKLKKEQKEWELLSHNWEQVNAPAHSTDPIKLQRGAYEICIEFIQPTPDFTEENKVCPQTTGFQLKYSGADTQDQLITIPLKHLFKDKKAHELAQGLDFEVDAAVDSYLGDFYPVTIDDFRNTYQRLIKAMVYAYRFDLSAHPDGDDGTSEIEFLLANGECFKGYSYNWDAEAPGYIENKVVLDFNLFPVRSNYCLPEQVTDERYTPSIGRQRAFTDQWETMFDYFRIKAAARDIPEKPSWKVFKEIIESIPFDDMDGDNAVHLLRHLGIDLNLYTLATKFYNNFILSDDQLKEVGWMTRVLHNARCLEAMQCQFTFTDLSTLTPSAWAADELLLDDGLDNLTQAVRSGLIEVEPRRYKLLQQINDGIRERSRTALITFLTGMNRVLFQDSPVTSARELSELLLMDVEAGVCQRMSRIEEALTAVQLFVQRARLGLEPQFEPGPAFNNFWDKQMATFASWARCKKRTIYRENWIEFDKLEEARKSEGFRQLEGKLRENVLSVPKSGGMTLLNSAKPPAHHPVQLLQKVEPAVQGPLDPSRDGFDLIASPEHMAQGSWLASIEPDKLPFWIASALRLQVPFVRVAAAGIPPAGITYDCEDHGCCSICGKIHDPQMDDYVFWLGTSEYYEEVVQDAQWAWDDENALPNLLHWNGNTEVYLVSSRIHYGEFQAPRWSSTGVRVNGTPDLKFLGRGGNSLNFEIVNGIVPPGDFGTSVPGFRYDLIPDTAVALPAVGEAPAPAVNAYGLATYPYFIYFEEGAPLVPKSLFSPAVTVAGYLKTHCQFENALKWYELELKPLEANNQWDTLANTEAGNCKKSLLLHYLQTLNDWGKALLRQNTKESVQQARLIFDTAKKIMGSCPKTVRLEDDLQAIQLIRNFQPMAIPLNPRLLCLYQEIEDGCSLVHECINAWRLTECGEEHGCRDTGTECTNIDNSCLDEMTWCLPESPYRFTYLYQKAMEYAGAVSALGNSLLSAYEKRDAETLAAIRERQGRQLLELNLEIRQNQLRSADWDVQALEKTLEITEARLQHYLDMVPYGELDPHELDYLDHIADSITELLVAQVAEIGAQGVSFLPDTYVGALPFTHTQPSGTKSMNYAEAAARIARTLSSISGTKAGRSSTKASWHRQNEERLHQIVVLSIEVEQNIRQLLSSERKRDSALKEVNLLRLQMTHAAETHDFLRDKFTNQELYQWMQKETAALYYKAYECALQTAYQALKAYRKECGMNDERLLSTPSWDHLHNGLLAGEKLQMELRRIEKAYMNNHQREMELMKNISLQQHFPSAFVQLKTTGRCLIDITEWLYDQDFPGHYMRRIRSLSLSIPAVVGPYTGVHAKVKLLSSRIRTKPLLSCESSVCCDSEAPNNPYLPAPNDSRFVYHYGAREAMATSNAQNDSGTRELNFRDERYLFFEYQGAVCTLCLELPQENNYFDICSVSDVILHVNYDAREGGPQLATAARAEASAHLPGDGQKLIDVPNELPDAWYALGSGLKSDESAGELLLSLGRNRFPFIPGKTQLAVNRIEVFFEPCQKTSCDHFDIQLLLNPKDRDEHPDKCELIPIRCIKRGDFGCLFHGVVELESIPLPDKGAEDLAVLIFPDSITCIDKLYLLLGYEAKRKEDHCLTKSSHSPCFNQS